MSDGRDSAFDLVTTGYGLRNVPAETVDAPGHDDVEPAPGGVLQEPVEDFALHERLCLRIAKGHEITPADVASVDRAAIRFESGPTVGPVNPP